MTLDVIRLAREAHGALVTEDYPAHTGQLDPWTLRLLERFAALVMEEDAKVCDENAKRSERINNRLAHRFDAEAIRARKPA